MPSEGWAVYKNASSSSSPTPAAAVAAPTGWSVRPAAVPALDDDDFFGVRSRTFKAASILKDLKESSGSGVSAQGSARPSLEVRLREMLFA